MPPKKTEVTPEVETESAITELDEVEPQEAPALDPNAEQKAEVKKDLAPSKKETTPAAPNKTPAPQEAPTAKETAEAEKAMFDEESQELLNLLKIERATRLAIDEIKKRMNDFDERKVESYLKELNKKDPARANSLNNPIGWELVWERIKPREVADDELQYKKDDASYQKGLEEKLSKGEGLSLEEQAEFLRKNLK